MNQTSDKTKEEIKKKREKLTPYIDNTIYEYPSINALTEDEKETLRFLLLQSINRQTLRTSKNIAFLVWMFIITLIIFIVAAQITEPLR